MYLKNVRVIHYIDYCVAVFGTILQNELAV